MARMQGDDPAYPAYLEVGTEVSAKYRGAFCEAKVRKVVKQVKAKVNLKFNMGTVVVSDEHIKGRVHVGASVEVKHPDKGQFFEGVVAKIFDTSQYTVVFDDGDITTLRRTSLCLKSGRHFTEAESLDHLPLTHPEHFSNPVRQRRRGHASQSDDSSDSDSDSDADGSPTKRAARKAADWMLMVGKVVSVEMDTNKKKKDNWFPALVVAPTAQIDARRDFLVRSFQDGRYYTVPKKETSPFQRDFVPKNNNILKTAIDKAVHFLDRDELPPHWDRDALFGTNDSETNTTASDSESSDEESREEKDHFVAQLYKFMDDRGTPINRAPTVGARDLDLHRLWKVVQRQGGYNKVTNQNVWKTVGTRLTQDASSPVNTNSVKVAYKRYLLHFEEFQRKLGCTLVSHTRGTKVRSSSGRSLIRERDRTASTGSPAPLPAPSPAAPPTQTPAKTTARERERASASPAPAIPPLPPLPPPPPPPIAAVKEEPPGPATPAVKSRKKAAGTPAGGEAEKKRVGEAEKKRVGGEAEKKRVGADVEKKRVGGEVEKKKVGGEAEKKRAASQERRAGKKNDVKDVKKEPPEETPQKTEDKEAETKFLRARTKESDSVSSASPAPSDKSDKTPGSAPAPAKTPRERRPSVRDTKGSPAPGATAASGPDAGERRRSGPVKRRKDESPDDDDPETLPPYVDVQVGDKVSVLYKINSKKERTIYEAKVLQVDPASPLRRYYIHYLNWNKRYDEWVKRNRIIENLSWAPTRARRNSRVETKPSGAASSAPSPAGSRRGKSPVVQSTPPPVQPPPTASTRGRSPVVPPAAPPGPATPTVATRGSTPASEPARSPAGAAGRANVPTPPSVATRGSTPASEPARSPAGAAGRANVPAAPSVATRGSTPASEPACSPAGAAGRANVRQSVERERRTARKGTPALSDSEAEPADGADDGAAPRRRPIRQRSGVPREPPDEDGKRSPPRRGSRRGRRRDAEPPVQDGSPSAETREERASAERTEADAEESAAPKPRRAEADSTSDAVDAADPTPAGARGSVSDIYEFTEECEEGFPARDASSKLKSVINTYGTRPSRSPGAAESPPAVPPVSAPAPAPAAAASPAPAAASPGSPAPSPSPGKKRKLVGEEARSPLSTPSKAARRTPTRRPPGQAASPRRPAKKRAASSPSPARVEPPPTGAVVTPKLTVTKLTEFQLSRVTLVSASAVKAGPLPPPPRLQPAPQVLGAEYKPAPLPTASEPAPPRPLRLDTVHALGKPVVTGKPLTVPLVRPPSAPPASSAHAAVAAATAALFPGAILKPLLPSPLPAPAPPAPATAPAPPATAPAQTSKPASAPAASPAPTSVPAPAPVPSKPLPCAAAPPSVSLAAAAVAAAAKPTTSVPAATSAASARESPGRWRHEPDSERRVAALSSPVKVSAGSGCDLTCRETIPGSPERVEGPGRPASAASDRMEMPFASLPSGVRPAAETERLRRDGQDEPLRSKTEPVKREEPERPRVKTEPERGARPKAETEQPRPKAEPERARPKPDPDRAKQRVEPEPTRAKTEPERSRPKPDLEPERVGREGAESRREEVETGRRADLERPRRQPATPDSPEGSEISSKRGSAQATPGGRSPISSEGETSPAAPAPAPAAAPARPPASRSAGSPPPEVNGLVASLAPASLPAGRGLRQQPPAPAPAPAPADEEPTARRRRSRRRRRRISGRSGKGVSDSDDLNDRSNGDRGEAEADSRRGDKPHKYNFMVTFDDAADRETRIQVLTEQIDKLRDRYSTVKAELGRVHRRIKKLKKKQRETPAPPAESVKKLRPSFVTP